MSAKTTLAQAAAAVRARSSEDRWRLGVTKGLAYWMEFSSVWMGASSLLRRAAPTIIVPGDLDQSDDDAVLAWGWAAVEHEANAVLMAVDQRSSIPSAVVVSHFRIMSGNALIFPDGVASPILSTSIEKRIAAMESKDNRSIALAGTASARLRGLLAKPRSAT